MLRYNLGSSLQQAIKNESCTVADGQTFELPLFPLSVVLFPRMKLPIRVFEPRYRQMLDYCKERDNQFGVVLIRSGREVGGLAEPHRIGTIAHVEEVEPLPDGTLAVNTVGTRRFHIVDMIQQRPFQLGLAEYLDEPESEPPAEAPTTEVQQIAQRCLKSLFGLNGEWVHHVKLPEQPHELAYAVAERLPFEPIVRQRILEIATASEQLQTELPLLQEEETRLARLLEDRVWLGRLSLN